MVTERSPVGILQVRKKLYDLLSHCIPPTIILKVILVLIFRLQPLTLLQTLTFKLVPMIDDALKADVIRWSAFHEHRIKLGSVSLIDQL